MSRNEEKAQSMLNRYLRQKRSDSGRERRRPHLAVLCDDVDEAEKWRLQILRDIKRQVSEIQNADLEENRVRELNDAINKLLRERGHWERRIIALGGQDHRRKRRLSDEMDEVFEHAGFFYFGAARDLPDVREMIEQKRKGQQPVVDAEETLEQLTARIDHAYFGRGVALEKEVLQQEEAAERNLLNKKVCEWEEKENSSADAAWDDSYLRYVGVKAEVSDATRLEDLLLERRKAEALDQLRSRT